MPLPADSAASYRTPAHLEPDLPAESDVIAELIQRTTAFRRTLLKITLGVSLVGGVVALALYGTLATAVYGRVGGAFFAAGSISTFVVVRGLCGVLAGWRDRRWIAESARRHQLDAGALAEAIAMFQH